MSAYSELQAWLKGTPTGGPYGDGRYPLTGADGKTYLLLCPAADQLAQDNLAVAPMTYAIAAKDSADAAAASAATAAASESAAAGSKSAAAGSETAAAGSATAAKTSETNAKTSEGNAKTSETNAKTSETNAKASETAAAASKTAAATSESNALASKNAAATSATNAGTSETNAAASKTAAAGSATAAANSASAASGSATAAANSAAAASGSEGRAKTSETNAKTSETNASTSASNSAGSASAASVNAGNASASATQAAASASAAASSTALAQKWAENGVDIEVTSGMYSAKHWATKAKTWVQGVTTVAGRAGDVVLGISDVVNLQSALDAKLPSTGGTVTGNLIMSNASIAVVSGAYTSYLSADASGVVGFINKARTAWNMMLDDSGTATFRSGVIATGALRASGWGGTATDGVMYFGSGDSYLYKNSVNFTFKNEQGGWTATLNAGGTIWTSLNFNPASKLDARGSLAVSGSIITDWNSADTNGWYMASGAANAPGNAWYMGRVTKHNDAWIQQELWDFTNIAETVRYRRHKLSGTWGPWTGRMRFDGNADPALGEGNCALVTTGWGGGGWSMIDNGVHGRIYMNADGGIRIGSGGSGAGISVGLIVYSNGIQIPGAPRMVNEGGVLRLEGQMRSYNRYQSLANDGSRWVENPRVFVQGNDPGNSAGDGDLWFW
ncbi:pyocin knob domain-containing protein [Dyella sp. ASV21]|uniref:pyocin knob domain-containing protein n=1 Tax=Dyella sp. ASV21 TaxID=2795114 RepID=UPI0018EB81D4|nr:pyocin knob domain-containing protein [Dyella sp. ASV21]